MSTIAFVLGSALVIAAELAFAIAHFDGAAVSDRGTLAEHHLDRELRDWMHRSWDFESDDTTPNSWAGCRDQRSIRCSEG